MKKFVEKITFFEVWNKILAVVKDKKIIDIGYGTSKVENLWSIDILRYPEVDQIQDLKNEPRDLPADHFEINYAQHVIEHVSTIPKFMNEVYRFEKY